MILMLWYRRSKTHAEDAPEMADVYVAYGRALLENAIAQSSVLGKEQQQQQEGDAAAEGTAANHLTDDDNSDDEMFLSHAEPAPNGNKILSFSGDAEDEEDGDDHDDHDPAVDLFAEASKPDVEGEGEEEAGEGADEAEPEDDFNAAWEVLEMARAIYEKQMDGNDEMRLKVADTFIMLGDISLETGASYPSLYVPKLSLSPLVVSREI
jgi:HAT1-interacting factor 1